MGKGKKRVFDCEVEFTDSDEAQSINLLESSIQKEDRAAAHGLDDARRERRNAQREP